MNQTAMVQCVLNGTAYFITRYSGKEELSNPFSFSVTIPRNLLLGSPSGFIGKTSTLVFKNDAGHERCLTGQVMKVSNDEQYSTLVIQPKLKAGQYTANSRLFLGKNRQEIIQQLLVEIGYQPDQIHWLGDIADEHVSQPVLQALESNYDFMLRLLAELKCFYWFGSDGYEEQLYIAANLAETPFIAGVANEPQQRKAAMNGKDSPLAISWSEQNANQCNTSSRWRLTGCFPTVASGASLTVPDVWCGFVGNDALTILTVTHQGNALDLNAPETGMKVSISAQLIRRSSELKLPKPHNPVYPMAFSATIESNQAFADVSGEGGHYVRMEFSRNNSEVLGKAMASPALERLAPFAQPNNQQPVGWHFPLIDNSSVLVTLLNNDPNRLCLLGFAPSEHQRGPVTDQNKSQYKLITPSKNEMCFDDALPSVLLQTLDGKLALKLDATEAQPYLSLAAQYGLIKLSSKALQQWNAQENYKQYASANYHAKAKQNLGINSESDQHWQSASMINATSENSLSLSSEENAKLKATGGGLFIHSTKSALRQSSATQATKIDQGRFAVQSQGDIRVKGCGAGDITLTNGKGGIQLEANGNIKLFGAHVAMLAEQQVSVAGNIEYETGGANQPIALNNIELEPIENLEPLLSEREPAIIRIAAETPTLKLGTTVALFITSQGLEAPLPFELECEQHSPNGDVTSLTTTALTLENGNGLGQVSWMAPNALESSSSANNTSFAGPYKLRVRAKTEQCVSPWSNFIQVNMDIVINITTDSEQQVDDGKIVCLTASDGEEHRQHTKIGKVAFNDIASGAYQVRIENHLHKSL